MTELSMELPVYARLDLDVVAAEGAELVLKDGRRILDFYAGHAVVLGAHDDPELAAALREQASSLRFQTSLVHTEVREQALQDLIAWAPAQFERALLVNSGAEANENALRAAFLHHARQSGPRNKVVAIEGGFHGRSAAASACTWGSESWYGFPRSPFDVEFVPLDDEEALQRAVDDTTAAVILEPVQGIAGARALSPAFLESARVACDRTGSLLICDEVQCGLGRTGEAFAHQIADITPDVITLAKGLGAGFPVGAVLATEAVSSSLSVGDLGTTFGGAPLACRAVSHVLRSLKDGLAGRVQDLAPRLREQAARGPVLAIDGRGFLLGLRCDRPARYVRDALLDRGLLVGTAADPHVLRLTPPYVMPAEHIERLGDALEEIAS